MTQMYLGEKPRKPYDVNKVRAAIKRCNLRMTNLLNSWEFGDSREKVQKVNEQFDRWQEASICLMRLVRKEYPTADLS